MERCYEDVEVAGRSNIDDHLLEMGGSEDTTGLGQPFCDNRVSQYVQQKLVDMLFDHKGDPLSAGQDQDSVHKPITQLKATLQFLTRNPLFETEKAYSIQYEPHGDVPQTNLTQDIVTDVQVSNIRPCISSLTLEKDGFVVRELQSRMKYSEFADPVTVKAIYLQEVHDLLKKELGTENVAILEYLVRRRHPSFPLSPGESFEYAQPVPTAHIDFSPDCIREILEDRYENRVEEILRFRYQVINIWKPLVGPLRDWPLCLCRPATIDHDRDFQLMDRVYPMNIEESIQIHYNPRQEWVYLHDQTPDEVLIFRSGDSRLDIRGGVPHCSFELPQHLHNSITRESIEVRALVCHTDEDLDMSRVSPSRRHGPKSTFLQAENRHQEK